jgi:NADPH:quinone reductase-like Zn-dependent oxidoreductase/acyl carrier protein
LSNVYLENSHKGLQLERLEEGQETIIEREDIYQNAALCGLRYGEWFQGVRRVLIGEDASVITEIEEPEGQGDNQGYLLNPVIMDSVFHTLFSLIQDDDLSAGRYTYVPVEIGSIQLCGEPGSKVYSECIIHTMTANLIRASFDLYDVRGQHIAEINDCLFRKLPRLETHKHTPDYYRYSEFPKNLINPLDATPLLSNSELLAVVKDISESEEALKSEMLVSEQVIPLFDALASAIAENTFRKFGAHLGSFTADSLISTSLITADYKPYLAYLLNILEQDGKAQHDGENWQMIDSDDVDDPVAIWRSILADYPQYVGLLRDTANRGLRTVEILSSLRNMEKEAETQLSLPTGTGQSALQEYILQLILKEITAHWPYKRKRLRIAEIRDHRYHSSMDLISMLPAQFCDYEILAMDDTALFQAEELYRDHVNVTVSSFDPETGGLQQKYREGEFDLVIISHGLPRNLSLSEIFSQIAYITAAQGMLILLDKRPDRITDINNGLLNSTWWSPTGDGESQVSNLLNPDEWLYLLENNGYGDVINLMDQISPELHHYVILARNAARTVKQSLNTTEQAQSCYLIACDGSESVQLARLLKTYAIRDGQQLPIVLANGSLSSADDMLDIDLLSDADQQRLVKLLESRGEVNLKVVYLAATGETQQVSSSLDIGHRISRSNMRLLNLMKILTKAEIKSVPSIWVVTSGAASSSRIEELEFNPNPNLAGLWSMGRVIRNEYPDIDLRMIDLQTNATAGHDSHQLWNEINFGDGEEEIILTGQARKALRIDETNMTTESVDREKLDLINSIYRLEFNRAGSIDNLEWHERQRSIPTGDELEIEVRATGLNFRDIMFTSGFLPAEMLEGGMSGASLGLECSGVVSRVGENVDEFEIGDEVIALAPACFSSHVIASRSAVTRKPQDWSFEAAATIPTAFFTVYYSLNYLARLRSGERILIHGAAGGVGLAAIQYAHYCGAEIFATAGTPEKRKFLEYLGVDHVFDSRTLNFADQIMAITGNQGVDIVLNSLAGEAMARNFKVLRPFGRFLELGKRDFFENTKMDLKPFRNNITYFGIDADQLLQHEPDLSAKMMREVMQLFNDGVFRPLPYSEFSASEVEKAFRYMQSSQHIGKVIVSQKSRSLKLRREIKKPILELKADATYMVTGGLSGFGLATAEWLAARGAKQLVLLGRRINLEPETRRVIKALTEQGVNVDVMQCDVTDAIKIQSVLHDIHESGFPLKGIFHAAMVLEDRLIKNLDYDAMYKVISPKVQGAWNLHRLTRDYDLDLFVLYSSVTTSIGNPGQANYVAANAFMESLAKFRKRSGLAATIVAWDAINDTGYLARNEELAGKTTRRLGLGGINTEQAFKALETLIVFGQTETIVFNANWSALKRALPVLNSYLYRNIMHGLEMNESMDGDDLIERLANMDDSEKQPLVVNFLIAEIARILQMPEDKIAHNCTIQDLGIDSLMAMELATTIEMKLGIGLPVMTLADNVTLDSLANRIINMLNPVDKPVRTDNALDEIVTSLAKIHAEDLTEEELRTISSDIDKNRDDSKRLIK